MDIVRSTALQLTNEHEQRVRFAPLVLKTNDIEVAYAIQDSYVGERWKGRDWAVAGWKIGLNNKRSQVRLGLGEPVFGLVRSPDVLSDGASLDAGRYLHLGLEMEICVRLGGGIDKLRDYSRDEVAGCIEAFGAAFEVVDDRNADYAQLDAFTLVADNAWNEGAVMGEMVPFKGAARLPGRTGVVSRNGSEIARAQYDEENGDLVGIVTWLAGSLRDRGRRLQAGQIVMTGTLFPPFNPLAGETFRFEVDGLPPVNLSVS